MLGDFDFVPSLGDLACGVNKICGANNAHGGFAVHRFFLPHAVLRCNGLFGVDEQREVKRLFVGEFCVGLGVVGADAQDHGVVFGKLSLSVAQGAGLGGAAWCGVTRIKVQHNGLALKGCKGMRCALGIGQGEGRGRLAGVDEGHGRCLR